MNRVKLGEVADTCLGKMLDAKKNKGTLHPYLANVNVRWGSFDLDGLQEMPFEDGEAERYGLKSGDLVMCEGGEPGRCALWTDASTDMRFQKALHRIRAHKDVLDIRYLYYWFLYAGKRSMLDRYFTQTTIKHLVGEDLRTVELDLPDLERQKEIADVLSLIDAKIEANNKTIAELDSLARTVYDYWFMCRVAPSDWEPVKVADLVEVDRGISYTANELADEGQPMLNLASFNTDGTIKLSGTKYLTHVAKDSKLLASGDLLMCTTQQTPVDPAGTTDVVARTFLVPNTFEVAPTFSMDVVRLKERRDGARFLVNQMMRRNDYHRYTSGYASGTKIKHLDVEGALSFSAMLPPDGDPLIRRYADLSLVWHKEQSTLLNESTKLVALRDWLLPMLMNGQVTIDSEAR